MIQAVADAAQGAAIFDGMLALAYVFAEIAVQVDTDTHADLYRFGEMVLQALDDMGEDDEGAETTETMQ